MYILTSQGVYLNFVHLPKLNQFFRSDLLANFPEFLLE